jgi:hypothetical protein
VVVTAISTAGVPIRLTDERWAHITEEHCELAGLRLEVLDTIAHPDRVLAGSAGELLAVRAVEEGSCSEQVIRYNSAHGLSNRRPDGS